MCQFFFTYQFSRKVRGFAVDSGSDETTNKLKKSKMLELVSHIGSWLGRPKDSKIYSSRQRGQLEQVSVIQLRTVEPCARDQGAL